ncbi:GatB/YqeY domain-containing protein [Candidatus Saganbacteria bacterium]|nr:GatB/YqeY domain-containing protein [Candidatus Saganbacteria bacterium]
MSEEKRELLNKINDDIKTAMKEKKELPLSVLRMMKSKILYVNARGDLSDPEIIKILTKYTKELKESMEEFKKVGRTIDADKVAAELIIAQSYLPKELSSEEIKKLVTETLNKLGLTSIKDMGRAMKEISALQPGIDGKLVSQFVRKVLK